MSEYIKGDVVRLSSGGPEMTIYTADPVSGKVQCQWFVGNQLEQGIFSKESLEKVENSITFNIDWRKLSYKERSIYLTPHEALIMELFLHHPNVPVSHEDIILLVSEIKQPKNPAELTRPIISRLKEKLKNISRDEDWIQSIRGTGYIFVKR